MSVFYALQRELILLKNSPTTKTQKQVIKLTNKLNSVKGHNLTKYYSNYSSMNLTESLLGLYIHLYDKISYI